MVVSRGIIVAVGKDAPIPTEAWVVDGTGLTALTSLSSFTCTSRIWTNNIWARSAPR